jgi:hypothetical protein
LFIFKVYTLLCMDMDMGSGLDWLGKMRRKGTHGASLDGSKGVYIIRGHRTGFGRKEGRWVAVTQKFPLGRNEMAAITSEP